MNFRNLKAEEIELRIGTVKAPTEKGMGGCSLLLYQNARCGMDILDETVGAENWQREHYEVKGNMFCRVGIRASLNSCYVDEKKKEHIEIADLGWIWKSDCGTESNTEKQKGEASDSFKRALVNWGIGRELYSAPFIWIGLSKDMFDEKGKVNYKTQKAIAGFKVSKISYMGKEIMELVIVDKDGTVVYQWKQ